MSSGPVYRAAPSSPQQADSEAPLLESTEEDLEAKASGSIASSIANLCNTILGTGMLAQPHAVAAGGLIPGAVTIAFSGCMSALGLYLLSCCTKRVGRMSSFSALSELTVPSARVWFDLAIALKCFGVSISYLMVFGSLAPHVVTSFLGESAPAMLVDRQLWITFAVVVLTPIAFLKSFTALRHTSYIALIAVADLVFVVIYKYFTRSGGEQQGHIDTFRVSPALVSSLPVFVFAFTCHQNLPFVYNELQRNSQPRMNLVIGSSLGTAVCIYELVGLLGYLTFGSKVASNVMESYAPSLIIDICRLLISVNVLFSYPLQLQPCRNSVLKIISSKPTSMPPRSHFNIVTIAILLTTFVIALSINQLEIILGFVGSTGSTTISFILPSLFYLKLHNHPATFRARMTRLLAYALFTYGCVVMVVCLSLNIYELVQPTHKVGRGKYPHHHNVVKDL